MILCENQCSTALRQYAADSNTGSQIKQNVMKRYEDSYRNEIEHFVRAMQGKIMVCTSTASLPRNFWRSHQNYRNALKIKKTVLCVYIKAFMCYGSVGLRLLRCLTTPLFSRSVQAVRSWRWSHLTCCGRPWSAKPRAHPCSPSSRWSLKSTWRRTILICLRDVAWLFYEMTHPFSCRCYCVFLRNSQALTFCVQQ